MSRRAYQRAERCFALARSTTFPGERAAAIAQGTKVAEKAGLSLDSFDIPGRKRSARIGNSPTLDRLFEGNGIFGDNFRYVGRFDVDIEALYAELKSAYAKQSHEVAEERRRRKNQIRVDSAVDFLRARGNVVRRDSTAGTSEPIYSVDGCLMSGESVLACAQNRGWRG